jgi:hypothetical protein
MRITKPTGNERNCLGKEIWFYNSFFFYFHKYYNFEQSMVSGHAMKTEGMSNPLACLHSPSRCAATDGWRSGAAPGAPAQTTSCPVPREQHSEASLCGHSSRGRSYRPPRPSSCFRVSSELPQVCLACQRRACSPPPLVLYRRRCCCRHC